METIRKTIFQILFWSGLGPICIAFQKLSGKVPIFLFHRVSPHFDIFTRPIHPKNFRNILKKMSWFYELKSLSTLTKNNISSKSGFICFDDGLQDFHYHAFPILKSMGISTTLFLPTSEIEAGKSIWNIEFFEIMLNLSEETNIINFKGVSHIIEPDSNQFYKQVWQLLDQLLEGTIQEIDDFLEKHETGSQNIQEKNMCSWTQIKEMNDQRIDVQCHTHHHLFLKGRSEKLIKLELESNKQAIEKHLDHCPNMVAYPNGGYDENVLLASSEYYDMGFTVDEKYVDLKLLSDQNYKMRIPRFNIQDSNFEEIYFRTLGFHRIILKIFK
jgi:peptidoglycan/xylan/chitin deacetylase (PgdA/CDA1 family)